MTMNDKQQFKVISPVKGKNDKTYWTTVGTAFRNKDDSINVYLDSFPKSFELQIRELTEEDRQRREAARARSSARGTPAGESTLFGPRGGFGAPSSLPAPSRSSESVHASTPADAPF